MPVTTLAIVDAAPDSAVTALLGAAARYDAADLEPAPERVLTAHAGGQLAGVGWLVPDRTAGTSDAVVRVDPDHRGPGEDVTAGLLEVLAAEAGRSPNTRLQWWVGNPDPASDRAATAAGLSRGRSLYEMRRPLPLEAELLSGAELATRSFVVGQDEAAWLEVNNRAFSWHPEQGGWTLPTIRAREQEPWFSAEGFLLHQAETGIDGFCWTKIHTEETPQVGEIYVIAADPARAPKGLGRKLTVAGLSYLAGQGLEVANLWCESDNVPALKLYVALGFRVHRINQCYHQGTC